MELVQIVLPVYDSAGGRHPREKFNRTLAELTERFGGVTAFTRAPAEGLWEDDSGRVVQDDVIVVEVMAEESSDDWWDDYRRRRESRFAQETILIRAIPCRVL